jgi:hypothetical protein
MMCARVSRELAHAVKAAALKRSMDELSPDTVAGILDAALRAWLRDNGYAAKL